MIRIIQGTHKGRRIKAPGNLPVRPTTDFAKQGLFNLLEHRLDWEDIKALDLFSGTGNISYEMASRGCPSIISVDQNFHCWQFIRDTALSLDLRQIRAVKSDVFDYLKRCTETFDFIFADPPFDMKESGTVPEVVFERKLLKPGGILVVEHSERTTLGGSAHLLERRHYGKVNFSIFGETPAA